MTAATAVDLYDTYPTAVRSTASRVNRYRDRLDYVGKSRTDYEGELALLSIESQVQFRDKRGFFPDEERRYVHGALSKRQSHLRRTVVNKRVFAIRFCDGVDTPEAQLRDVESHLEARAAIRVLRSRLDPYEFGVLSRLAESGGPSSSHDPEIDGSIRTYRRRVQKICSRARRILAAK